MTPSHLALVLGHPTFLQMLCQSLSVDISAPLLYIPDQSSGAGASPPQWSKSPILLAALHADDSVSVPMLRLLLKHGADPLYVDINGRPLIHILVSVASLPFLQALFCLLSPDQLSCRAVHAELGEIPLGNLLAEWVIHDLSHIRQLVMAAEQAFLADTGAWRPAYQQLELRPAV